MQYTTLGRTGLKVSVAGLGCGGPSRLGLAGLKDQSNPESYVIAHVRGALDLGINFFDTAEWYGTEGVVGKAIAGVRRDGVVIPTKKNLGTEDHPDPAGEIRRAVEQSLKTLGTDYVDVYHVHGAEPKDYENALNRHLPTMLKLRDEGKIRFVGITERFVQDSTHAMAERAVRDGVWDVVMVGFNLLNPCARDNVFPLTKTNGVGTLISYALRRALSQPERLKKLCGELIEKGALAKDAINPDDPLDFVIQEGGAVSVQDAAYRFCRHEPGVDVVLTGTGNPAHLKANVESLCRPALPIAVRERLAMLFGNTNWLTGNQ
ncbi:MAG: aldo/keto reductase [Deltaproteobacteria bacterium]|nr:aldo/keto reductase [Deltaproteobacteria bacterium]